MEDFEEELGWEVLDAPLRTGGVCLTTPRFISIGCSMVSDEVKRARTHGLIESFEELRNVKGVTIALRNYELGWRRGIRLVRTYWGWRSARHHRRRKRPVRIKCQNKAHACPQQQPRVLYSYLRLATLSQAVYIRGGKICYVAEYTSSASLDCYNA